MIRLEALLNMTERDAPPNTLLFHTRYASGLTIPKIEEGELANITLFDPEQKWKLEQKNIVSKSRNTPFIGKELKGKVVGIYNRKKLVQPFA